ncbi:MAG: hypothetical protein RJB41_606 [Actinomycetota bacterium]|jgi:Flp pilus assembly protein TadG
MTVRLTRSSKEEVDLRDRGAAVLEFALIVPLMLIMLVGIIEFGRAYNVVISLQGAVREGARSLALGNSSATVAGVVRSSTAITIDGILQTPCPVSGGTATVIANQVFTFGIPFVPLTSMTLEARASMRCGL